MSLKRLECTDGLRALHKLRYDSCKIARYWGYSKKIIQVHAATWYGIKEQKYVQILKLRKIIITLRTCAVIINNRADIHIIQSFYISETNSLSKGKLLVLNWDQIRMISSYGSCIDNVSQSLVQSCCSPLCRPLSIIRNLVKKSGRYIRIELHRRTRLGKELAGCEPTSRSRERIANKDQPTFTVTTHKDSPYRLSRPRNLNTDRCVPRESWIAFVYRR